MSFGTKRKKKLSEFTIKQYGINGGLMAILFLFGLYLSWELSSFAGGLYVISWLASYPIIHTTTCRNCFYHGKQCPIPLEGGCSQLTANKGNDFGLYAYAGALLAYFLRLCIPYLAIFDSGSVLLAILYTGTIVVLFYVHFYHTGCPNCINAKCPMNPDFGT